MNYLVQPLKGFRDFVGAEMISRNRIKRTLSNIFEKWGYLPIQTPTLEKIEVLFGEYGNEANKLIYSFMDNGNRKIGLKYDLTVPTARVIGRYAGSIIQLPYRRYQIQSVFRAENTQSGRYREFEQCDIDMIGADSIESDVEMLCIGLEALLELGIAEGIEVRVNSRILMNDILNSVKVPNDLYNSTIQIIDMMDKLSIEEVEFKLIEIGLTKDIVECIINAFEVAKPNERLSKTIEVVRNLYPQFKDKILFYPSLARGLDYYSDIVYEIKVVSSKEEYSIGCIISGGRYNNLLSRFRKDIDAPAIGISFGLDRIYDILEIRGLLGGQEDERVMILNNGVLSIESLFNVSKILREFGYKTYIFPKSIKVDKQMSFSSKTGFKYISYVDADSNIVLKDIKDRTESIVSKL